MFPDLCTIAASFEDSNGYGYFTNRILRHMVSNGVRLQLTPLFGHNPPQDLMPFVSNKRPKVHDIVFTSISNNPTDVTGRILFTMSEVMDVPWEYGHPLGRYKYLIVPSKYSADAAAKWHKRVYTCPLGAEMPWSPTPFDPFVFTAVGADHLCPERKRIQELVDTFSRTFPTEPDVRLHLKRTQHCAKLVTFDRRVVIADARFSRAEYATFFRTTTVLVQPSAMEGWSLPVNEALCAGRAIIAPRAGAIGDYLPSDACFEVETTRRKAPVPVFLGKGTIPYADMAGIGRQMRFAYENRFEVARRAVRAHEISHEFTTHMMGKRFLDLCQTLLS